MFIPTVFKFVSAGVHEPPTFKSTTQYLRLGERIIISHKSEARVVDLWLLACPSSFFFFYEHTRHLLIISDGQRSIYPGCICPKCNQHCIVASALIRYYICSLRSSPYVIDFTLFTFYDNIIEFYAVDLEDAGISEEYFTFFKVCRIQPLRNTIYTTNILNLLILQVQKMIIDNDQ